MDKIAIIGGTGAFGRGLAARLSFHYEVLLGSREVGKARTAAREVGKLTTTLVKGFSNQEAAERCDFGILAVPDLISRDFVRGLRRPLEGKLVISPVVPMRVRKGFFEYDPPAKSAAEWLAEKLPKSTVTAALHTIPAARLLAVKDRLDYDVFVAADERSGFERTASILRKIASLRPLYVGPLAMSRYVEALTPLLLNLSKLNRMRDSSLKVV